MMNRRGSAEERELTPELLKAGIRRQTIANKFVPVIGGSALKILVFQYLVDAVVDYLPSPLDIPPAKGQNPIQASQWKRLPMTTATSVPSRSAVERSVCRKLVFFRVYSGSLSKGDTVYNRGRTNVNGFRV